MDGPKCRLADAQFVIARSHGFESWNKFTKHLEQLSDKRSLVAKFEAAADAICNGDVVEFLLDKDVDFSGQEGDGQSPLHCAAIGGRLETIKFLLKQNAPLEVKNAYGGTVLGQTLWSAAHGGDPKLYAAIIKVLIEAGATVPERHVPVNKPIDDLLRTYGSVPEPTWYWFGEKPRRRRSSA